MTISHLQRLLACGPVLAGLFICASTPMTGQTPAASRLTVVTINDTGPQNSDENLEGWQFSSLSRSYQKTWTAHRRSSNFVNWPGLPIVVDYDGDQSSDLIAPDRFGLTVYGATPKYFPFAIAVGGLVQVCTCDVDGDGLPEVITQRGSDTPNTRDIETWKVSGASLVAVGKHVLPVDSASYVLLCEDVNADGRRELISSEETIRILSPKDHYGWQLAAELPVMGYVRKGPTGLGNLVDVVRVADVNADGLPEILTGGNSGRLTIFRHARLKNGSDVYPVIWKSPVLHGPGPSAFTQGLAVGDVDNDGGSEILVGTIAGQIHVFKFDGKQDFRPSWSSGPTQPASIPAFAVGDLDSDGQTEFVYNGRDVYKHQPADGSYRVSGQVGSRQNENVRGNAVVGHLPDLREPSAAVRIVPVGWSLRNGPQSQLRFGELASLSVSLLNVWSAVKGVTLEITSDIPGLRIEEGLVRIPAILSGETVVSPPITLQAPTRSGKDDAENSLSGSLRLTISAAGGYRQVVPLPIRITER